MGWMRWVWGFKGGVLEIPGNGKPNQRIQWVMDDDLAKIKKILETLLPDISVVEFIPPAPPVEEDEEPKPERKN